MTDGEITYIEAVQDAHREVLRAFDDAFVMGEDVEKSVFESTVGLVEEFGPERVRNTPISEQAFTGLGIGAAMDGKRPIVELEINTLPHVAMEQIVDQAARIHFLSGGGYDVPLTITLPSASVSGGHGGQHSDNPHASLLHYGLKTAIPSTPRDAKGLFHAAVAEDDPVLVSFPMPLHDTTGEVPATPDPIPLGEAAIRRQGEDVTVVAIGETVPDALAAAEAAEADVEVVDPRTLLPLDEATILDSARKTGRVVVVDSAGRTCGAAAEIASRVSNRAFDALRAPVKRVTRPDTHVSWAPTEEFGILPDSEAIERAVADVAP